MQRPRAYFDIECFINWFLVGFTDDNGNRWEFQMTNGSVLDVAGIMTMIRHFTLYSFNGKKYDEVMLAIALTGASCETLKIANDDIIVRKQLPWVVLKKYRARVPKEMDHVDISEPTPGVKLTLKQYAGRAHAPEMIETPVDFSLPMPEEHIADEVRYCGNDREVVKLMLSQLKDRMAMREAMGAQYSVDLRSKSDAQIAEAVIKAEVTRIIQESEANFSLDYNEAIDGPLGPHMASRWPHLGADYTRDNWGNIKINIPHYAHGTTFKARIPDYVEFATPYMQEFLQLVRNCDFFVSNKDEAEFMGIDGRNIKTGVRIPEELKGRDIIIGGTVYRVGIGGLHSQESSVSYRSIPGVQTLRTADVASYYPSLILNAGMSPKQLGDMFLDIYRTIYTYRLKAKKRLKEIDKRLAVIKLMPELSLERERANIKAIESGYKTALNGSFGKLFNRHSIFYAPEFGIAVTIGGQLSLLMLIERLNMSGIRVVSANTDGIEMLVPACMEWIVDGIIKWWMDRTKLGMDQENYLALYSRDVNNYISIQFDGSVKRKGVFRPSGLVDNKHPDCDICADAVVAFLTKGTPIKTSIDNCWDIRKFVRVRGVKNGGVYCRGEENGEWGYVLGEAEWVPKPTKKDPERGEWFRPRIGIWGAPYLGKAVRWYYSTVPGFIADKESCNKSAGSDFAMPCMTLPASIPPDLDRNAYIDMAIQMLGDIGYV